MIGSSIASDLGDFAEGATVDIDAGTKDGYTFTGWRSDNAITLNDPASVKTFFTMIAEAVTITATWLATHATRLAACKAAIETKFNEASNWSWNSTEESMKDLVNNTITTVDTEVTFTVNDESTTTTPSTDKVPGKIDYSIDLALDTDSLNMTGVIALPVVPAEEWAFTCTVIGSNAEVSGAGKYKGSTVVNLDAGTVVGKTFNQWTSETPGVTFVDSTVAVTQITMPLSDAIVTATWNDIDYTITMDESCDTAKGPDATYNYGETVTVKCTHGDFVEWSCDDPTVVFADKTVAETTFTMPAKNITIDHSFKSYTVAVNSQFATTGAGSYLAGQVVTLTTQAVPEYNFGGWTTDSGVVIENAATMTATFVMPSADVIINNTWDLILYNLTVMLQDLKSTGYEDASEITVDATASGTEVTLDILPGNYLDGYKFVDCVVATGTLPEGAILGETPAFIMPSENVVLHYRRNPNLTLEVIGLNGSTESDTRIAYINDVIQLDAGNKIGSTFRNWTSDPVDGVTISNTNTALTSITMKDQNVKVHANWDAIEYTVTFDDACNSVVGGPTFHSGDVVSISCNKAEFVEWSSNIPSVTFADKTNADTTFVMPASNITIDHLFSSYNVTLTNAEDTGAGSYRPGDTVTITAGNKSGKEFAQWSSDNVTVVINPIDSHIATFTMPADDINITSNWNDSYLTITSEGAVSASDTLKALPAGSVDLVIPSEINGIKVTTIGAAAFYTCSALTSVSIPDGVTNIQANAFDRCKSLTSVNIPNGVTTIGAYAFYNCLSLTSIDIPNSVTTIDAGTFQDCRSLTSINIPNSVKSIGTSAFSYCTLLTSINIDKPVDSITGSPWGASVSTVNWSQYQVTLNGVGTGAVGSGLHAPGSTVTINVGTLTPPEYFNNWTGLPAVGSGSATSTQTTFIMPKSNITITAVKKTMYNVTVTGSKLPANENGAGLHESRINVTVKAGATPAGKKFIGWKCLTGNVTAASGGSGGGTLPAGIISSMANMTFTMPSGNVEMEAVWVDLVPVTVTGSNLPNDQNGTGNYAPGDTVTVKAGAPAAGMVFVGWECSTNNVTPL